MNSILLEVPVDIDALIERLTVKDKIELVRKLEADARRKRWAAFFDKVDKKAAGKNLSQKEIDCIVKETRKGLYAKSGH